MLESTQIVTITGIIGLIVISYAIWIKNERKQDFLFIIGGLSLLSYSFYQKDLIFFILQIIFIASAFIELLKLKKR